MLFLTYKAYYQRPIGDGSQTHVSVDCVLAPIL